MKNKEIESILKSLKNIIELNNNIKQYYTFKKLYYLCYNAIPEKQCEYDSNLLYFYKIIKKNKNYFNKKLNYNIYFPEDFNSTFECNGPIGIEYESIIFEKRS
jgi:hypothetical protein